MDVKGISIRRAVTLSILLWMTVGASAQTRLSKASIEDALVLGKNCGSVPLMKISKPRGDFEVFIEDPFARIAIHAAAARQMHQPFDASKITADIAAPDYRLWVQYTPDAQRTITVTHVRLQPRRGTGADVIRPARERSYQLTVGTHPAHGIITEVRWRNWEWIFDRLPAEDFDVILETSAGPQRYAVTSRDRASVMKVCP
jgi:hypothetical protein